ncbi:hypothetical protein AC1031_007984 [Aphanomyces cochlioides]|nr:hypothetical protein AC1031_007984 [Aphanomyces cochlioides]
MPLTDDLAVYIPSTDLAFRVLLPPAFDEQLVMEHNTPAFFYRRRFLVMTDRGLRLKECDGSCHSPIRSPHTETHRTMKKVIDMICCASMEKREQVWYMVRIRWRDLGPLEDTWIEVAQVENTALLQEFYVGSMYSWGMSDLVARTARYRYRTEDQLWDDDPELKLWLKENNATVKRAQLPPAVQVVKPGDPPKHTRRDTSPAQLHQPPHTPSQAVSKHPSEQYSFHYTLYGPTSSKKSSTSEQRGSSSVARHESSGRRDYPELDPRRNSSSSYGHHPLERSKSDQSVSRQSVHSYPTEYDRRGSTTSVSGHGYQRSNHQQSSREASHSSRNRSERPLPVQSRSSNDWSSSQKSTPRMTPETSRRSVWSVDSSKRHSSYRRDDERPSSTSKSRSGRDEPGLRFDRGYPRSENISTAQCRPIYDANSSRRRSPERSPRRYEGNNLSRRSPQRSPRRRSSNGWSSSSKPSSSGWDVPQSSSSKGHSAWDEPIYPQASEKAKENRRDGDKPSSTVQSRPNPDDLATDHGYSPPTPDEPSQNHTSSNETSPKISSSSGLDVPKSSPSSKGRTAWDEPIHPSSKRTSGQANDDNPAKKVGDNNEKPSEPNSSPLEGKDLPDPAKSLAQSSNPADEKCQAASTTVQPPMASESNSSAKLLPEVLSASMTTSDDKSAAIASTENPVAHQQSQGNDPQAVSCKQDETQNDGVSPPPKAQDAPRSSSAKPASPLTSEASGKSEKPNEASSFNNEEESTKATKKNSVVNQLRRTSPRKVRITEEANDSSDNSPPKRQLKRLRRNRVDSSSSVDSDALSPPPKRGPSTRSQKADEAVETPSPQKSTNKTSSRPTSKAMKLEPPNPIWRPSSMPRSTISCYCGSVAVEDYTGEWIQCWTESCGTWFHATCVVAASPFVCSACSTIPPATVANRLEQLYQCCESNASRMFRLALAHETKSNFLNYKQNGSNGLLVAAARGSKAVLQDIQQIFEPDECLSIRDLFDRNPLHLAVLNRHFQCIPVLTLIQPKWLEETDMHSHTPLFYLLQKQPAQVLSLLTEMPHLKTFVNATTGNTIVHDICQVLPSNFDALIAAIPREMIEKPNIKMETPAMLAAQQGSFNASHLSVLITNGSSAAWMAKDQQHRTIVHHALLHKHNWIISATLPTLFADEPLVHFAVENGLATAVTTLVDAKFEVTRPHPQSGLWPIMHSTTASCSLALLRVSTFEQLQYVFENRKTESAKLLQLLNWMASYLPLFDFLQEIARSNPIAYLSPFFVRFRKCLRLDIKREQLRLFASTIQSRQPIFTMRIPSEAKFWETLSLHGTQYPIQTWRQEIAIQFTEDGMLSNLLSTRDVYIWNVLALQLRRLGHMLFSMEAKVFVLLGRLLGHMVLVNQRLPLAILPPPFLDTPAVFKPNLAAHFKSGFSDVLPGALDNWNGFEWYVLLHHETFPNTFDHWKTTKIRYDAPFSPNHPTIQWLWEILEKRLVADEQTILRLKWGQPLTIRPAESVAMLERAVFGIPENTSFDRLHVELMLYIRGFRKQAKK